MIEQLYIEEIYSNMTDVPNIIRGATNGDLEEIKEALRNDPDCINETDPDVGVTALHIACFDGNYEIVDFLCSQPGVEVYVYDNLGRIPWYAAYAIGRDDICERLLRDTQARIDARIEREEAEEAENAGAEGKVTQLRPRPPQI